MVDPLEVKIPTSVEIIEQPNRKLMKYEAALILTEGAEKSQVEINKAMVSYTLTTIAHLRRQAREALRHLKEEDYHSWWKMHETDFPMLKQEGKD